MYNDIRGGLCLLFADRVNGKRGWSDGSLSVFLRGRGREGAVDAECAETCVQRLF